MSLNICGGVLDAIFGASVLGWVRREAGLGRAYDMFASWDPPTRRDGVGVDAAVGGSLFGSVVLLVLLRVKHRTNSPTLLSTPPSSRPSSRTSYTLPGDSLSTAFRPPSSRRSAQTLRSLHTRHEARTSLRSCPPCACLRTRASRGPSCTPAGRRRLWFKLCCCRLLRCRCYHRPRCNFISLAYLHFGVYQPFGSSALPNRLGRVLSAYRRSHHHLRHRRLAILHPQRALFAQWSVGHRLTALQASRFVDTIHSCFASFL